MIFDAFLRKIVSQWEAEEKERKKTQCEKETDGQIDTNWERDDAARFRGRESSMVLRKNNNGALNYQLVSLICRAARATVIRAHVECRSSAAADLFQCIPAETMAHEIVSEIIQITETRWKYNCLVHNFLRSATTLEGGALVTPSKSSSVLFFLLLHLATYSPIRPVLSVALIFQPTGAISYRNDPTYWQSSSHIVFIREPSCHRRRTAERSPAGSASSSEGNSNRPRKENRSVINSFIILTGYALIDIICVKVI